MHGVIILVLVSAAQSRRESTLPFRRTSSSTFWCCRRPARRRGSTDFDLSTVDTTGVRRSCAAIRTCRDPRSTPALRSSADLCDLRPCAPDAGNAAQGWTVPAAIRVNEDTGKFLPSQRVVGKNWSLSSDLGQIPAEAATPWLRGQCVTRCAYSPLSLCCYKMALLLFLRWILVNSWSFRLNSLNM